MKKSTLRNLGVMAVALCLVTTSLLGGTLAKYTTKVEGGALANVAAWSFKVDDIGTKDSAFDLTDSLAGVQDKLKAKVMAPGTEGSFTITLDGSGSDVGIDYSVLINAPDGVTLPTGLTFESDAATTGTFAPLTLGTDIKNTINYSATADAMKKVITVKWSWDYTSDATGDEADTTFASNASFTMPITVTATQVDPTTAP